MTAHNSRLILIPTALAFVAGGLVPTLFLVDGGFSLIGAIGWACIIGILDYTLLTTHAPPGIVKGFRGFIIVVSAFCTTLVIDHMLFKNDIEQAKREQQVIAEDVISAEDTPEYKRAKDSYNKKVINLEISEAKVQCEISGETYCGTEHGVDIRGSGTKTCGPNCKLLKAQRDEYYKSVIQAEKELNILYDKIQNELNAPSFLHEIELLWDFIFGKNEERENNVVAMVVYLAITLLLVSLEGYVLFMKGTESIFDYKKRKLKALEAQETYLRKQLEKPPL